MDPGQRIASHAVVVDAKGKPAVVNPTAYRLGYPHKLTFGSIIRAQNLQPSLVALVSLFASLFGLAPLVLLAVFGPILRIQFDPATLRSG